MATPEDCTKGHYRFETQAIRTQLPQTSYREHSAPLFLTSSFTFEDAEQGRAIFAEETEAYSYSRFNNPNQQELVDKICQMEGAEAGYAFATGMAAVYCCFAALFQPDDHILSCSGIFGSTLSLLYKTFPERNIKTSFFHFTATEKDIESLIRPNTRALFLESPTNPCVDLLDLELLNRIAKKHGLLLIVDNTFSTPYLQTPISWGADVVLHSATKLLDGQGRVCGGLAVGKKAYIDPIYLFARTIGTSISPFHAWILSKSLETLHVRIDRHCENAIKIAQFLEEHPAVDFVKYPGLLSHPQYELAQKYLKQGGNVLAFSVKGGLKEVQNFMNAIRLISLSANVGDSRSILTHPSSTTHCRLSQVDRLENGITDQLIRFSVGLEHVEDLIADLDQALTQKNQSIPK